MSAVSAMLVSCHGSSAPARTESAPGASESSPDTSVFGLGVAAGDVADTSAVLWSRAEGAAEVSVEVARDASFSGDVTSASTMTSGDRDYTVKLKVDRLEAATRYYYRFRAGAAVSRTGTFVTAPAASASMPVRFVVAGDSNGSRGTDGKPPFNDFDVLTAAAAESPDFFVYLGDTIYADWAPVASTLAGYRAKYRENRAYPALANLLARTPAYVTWDDHEVENDFGSGTEDTARLEAGLRAFREYMPIDDGGGKPA